MEGSFMATNGHRYWLRIGPEFTLWRLGQVLSSPALDTGEPAASAQLSMAAHANRLFL